MLNVTDGDAFHLAFNDLQFYPRESFLSFVDEIMNALGSNIPNSGTAWHAQSCQSCPQFQIRQLPVQKPKISTVKMRSLLVAPFDMSMQDFFCSPIVNAEGLG
jgi:hypothetical protein